MILVVEFGRELPEGIFGDVYSIGCVRFQGVVRLVLTMLERYRSGNQVSGRKP